MPLDAGLVALAEELKSRGLRALSPVTSPIAECRDMQSRIAAVVNEGSVPLACERDVAIPRLLLKKHRTGATDGSGCDRRDSSILSPGYA